MASTALVGGSFHLAHIAAAVITSFSRTPSSRGTVGAIALSDVASRVSVPVVSTHRTFIVARSSTTLARATMADLSANARAPSAVVVDTMVLTARGALQITNTTQNDRDRKKSRPLTMR